MPGPSLLETRREARDESTLLLAERVRLGLWLVFLGAILFAVSDLRFEPARVVQLYLLKLAHLPFILVSVLLLRRFPRRLLVLTVALVQVGLLCLLTAVSGYVAAEEVTGPIMIVFIVFAAALIVPWGPGFQTAAALVAAGSLVLHQVLLHGNADVALTHDGFAVVTALAASVLVAWDLERQRRMQMERDLDRRRAEEALAAAEERKSAILGSALDGIITTDRRMRVLEMNPAAERMFGYRKEEIAGRELADLVVPPQRREVHRRDMASMGERGEGPLLGRRVEVNAMRADGSEFPAELAITKAGEGDNLTFTGYVRDLTEQRRAEREQRRLVEILEATTDLVGTTDETGQVLYYNAAGRELLGIGADEDLSLLRSADNMPERWWKDIAEGSVQAALAGRAWRGETEMITRDGSVVPVSQVIVAHREADGRISAFSTIARDISVQKRAESALQEDADVSRATARLGQELIAALGLPGLNQRVCELTAAVLQSDVSHTYLWDEKRESFAFFAGLDLRPSDTQVLSALAIPPRALGGLLDRLEKADAVQVCLLPGAGATSEDELDLEASGVAANLVDLVRRRGFTHSVYMPLRKGGKLIGFQTAGFRGRQERLTRVQMRIARAIGQMASLVIEHAQLVDALERANSLKSEFVATMSHELRTPLNVIMGYNALLSEGDYGPVSEGQREVMQRIDRSSQELLELINATLDMSRLDAGRLPIEVGEIDGDELLRDAEAEARRVRLKPGVALRWEAASDLPRMRTDAGKIKLVLRNLIGNAAKFTDKGSITVVGRRAGDSLELRVSDTGIGISAAAQPIIFEAFRQVDGSSTRRHGGVGLGLYIVKRLIGILGGTVEVQSEEGVGTTFTVVVPNDVEAKPSPTRAGPNAPPTSSDTPAEPALKRTASA